MRTYKSLDMRPKVVATLAIIAGLTLLFSFSAAAAESNADLAELSLEDLMNTEVTSVSKKAQSKHDTAAAITVITSEDLRRGGFTSVPEALRVVPGIQVARIDANRWAISARGFNSGFNCRALWERACAMSAMCLSEASPGRARIICRIRAI